MPPGPVSVSFKTGCVRPAYGGPMTPQFNAISLIVSDMAASVAFYRRLGFAFPEGSEGQPHAEAALPGGIRLLLDTEESIRSFTPGWEPPAGGRAALARPAVRHACRSGRLLRGADGCGVQGRARAWDAPWGQRYAVLGDPDGHGVDLFAPLA